MQTTCRERVRSHLKGRTRDLRLLFEAYQDGDEGTVKDRNGDEIGTFNEYGLGFDYVAPGTFNHQPRGYFRYQLSYGGPSDEFRFYTDERLNPTSIQYWFLDWFDGARITLKGNDKGLLLEIWDFFREVGSVEAELEKAQS